MGELFEKLKEYADSDHLPMHMPGHKRCMGDLGNPFFIDITEIEGFDNLHHAEGILQEAQKRAACLYHSEETHFLVNGSTAGILAAISGCTSFGGKLLLARNSHKSAYHAVMLRGLKSAYIYPQSAENMGINGAISSADVEDLLEKNPDAQAVMITSPTYDGVVSDVRQIAKLVHRHGLPLIVDAAHGAHFPFSAHFPEDAVACGADVVIHSLHKTLPSLTQTALIHLNGRRIDREKIRKYLTVYQSSSPSYVLMASLDNCVEWISGHKEAFEQFRNRLQDLREGLGQMRHLKLLTLPGMDKSKILVSVGNSGITGHELARRMREEYHIELEMACSTYVCAITSVADSREHLQRLLRAFLEIDGTLEACGQETFKAEAVSRQDTVLRAEPVCTIQEAEEGQKEGCRLSEAEGRISGDFVTLYPPGIPILAPGERVLPDILKRLHQYMDDGFELHGLDGDVLTVLKRERAWER